MTDITPLYKDVIDARRSYSLTILNKIIEESPSRMAETIQKYEEQEAQWKKADELMGFDFEEFKKQNGKFLETLKQICKEMNSS